MSRVVHCKKEKYDIYIGRPSKWGNPFSHKDGTLAKYKVSTVNEAIQKYEEFIRSNEVLMNSISELKDVTLGCWCHPNPCHGDVLIKLVKERFSNE